MIPSARTTFQWLASPPAAVILVTTLTFVLAAAAILEVNYGSAYSSWFVYKSRWFLGLIILGGIHVSCAAASRFPWKRQHAGFVIIHAGLLVLLTGAALSCWGGSQGHVTLAEGQTAQEMVLADEGQITASWVGRPQKSPFEFRFAGGPADWPAGKFLDLGGVAQVKVRVLAYYPHATADESWVADASGLGGPALRFRTSGPSGAHIAEGWLVDQLFGDAVTVGPIRLQLERAVSDRMLEDFLQPSRDGLGEKGRLAMYLRDVVTHVSVDTCVGRKIPLGSTGVMVEIADYFPNAVPDRLGNFTSKDKRPKNPMVELRVYLPGESQPLRQIAFARDPLLNLDGVYARVCPVKFRFDHSAVPRQTGVEFLQSSAGKLHGRLLTAEASASTGELHPGDKLQLPSNFHVEIVEHIPRARRKVTFSASDTPRSHSEQDTSQPAALVEVTVGDRTEQVWLRRDDPAYGRSTLTLPSGRLALSYESGRVPLGFSLELVELRRQRDAGGGSVAHSSTVRILDPQRGLDEQRVISKSQPLKHGNYTLYQTDFEQVPHDRKLSSFSATCDPGRAWKYFGGFTTCLGIVVIISTRAFGFACRIGSSCHGAHQLESAVVRDERPEGALGRAA